MAASEPFLEIITRVFRRPAMLERNQASLEAQTDPDWRQTLLIDEQGRGINRSHENLGRYALKLVGRYIWILDDDDLCIRPTLVAELKLIVTAHRPEVIMLKMDHGPRGVLPGPADWGREVKLGGVGVSAYVVRRDLWQFHAGAWSPGVYYSDYNFIAAVLAAKPRVYWHDVIASRVQRISLGQPERRESMQVRAVVSFIGYTPDGNKHRINQDDEFELPKGVDWKDKGLVVPVKTTETTKKPSSSKKKS